MEHRRTASCFCVHDKSTTLEDGYIFIFVTVLLNSLLCFEYWKFVTYIPENYDTHTSFKMDFTGKCLKFRDWTVLSFRGFLPLVPNENYAFDFLIIIIIGDYIPCVV